MLAAGSLALVLLAGSGGPTYAQTVDGVLPAHAPLFLSSADQGPWLAADKELHVAGSLAIAASLRVEGQRRGRAVALSFGVGVAKEIYDAALKPRRMGRGASWKDLVADLAGALAGVALLSAID